MLASLLKRVVQQALGTISLGQVAAALLVSALAIDTCQVQIQVLDRFKVTAVFVANYNFITISSNHQIICNYHLTRFYLTLSGPLRITS